MSANRPVSTPRGIYPGRVTWSHAQEAATWKGKSCWYDKENITIAEPSRFITYFLIGEFSDLEDGDYCDIYLIEAALVDDAPSGVKYDPEGDGTFIGSFGAAEHWNNVAYKQYTRNLGTGAGIKLIYSWRK